jgi:citrate synthase
MLSILIASTYPAAMDPSRFLTTEQAAGLLGVKAATVYAYVSRGQLTRHPGPDRRSSRFDRAEVERLAAHNRRGGRAGALEVVIDTELSLLDAAGTLHYRGHDATTLVRTHTFEQVATLLWTDAQPDDQPDDQVDRRETDETDEPGGPWRADPVAVGAARTALDAIGPDRLPPPDALRVIVATAAGLDPLRHDRRPAAVVATARTLIATMVEALPHYGTPATSVTSAGVSIAGRLWRKLAGGEPDGVATRAMEAALILSADHELATSALAGRVAASVWADPYLAVLAGLATMGGLLHVGSVGAAEGLVRDVWDRREDEVARLVGERLAGAAGAAGFGPVPGFGHVVYAGRDPRSDTLRSLVRKVGTDGGGAVDRLVRVVGAHGGPVPNFDLAMAELSVRGNFVRGGAEAAYMVGRVAGLVGHTLEEYPHRHRFRPRAVYIGRRPG